MSTAVFCECGAVLVEELTKEGVVPVGGEPIAFRRETDYVICQNCHRVYKAKMLLEGKSPAESLADGTAPPPDADAEDVIARLERLVEEG